MSNEYVPLNYVTIGDPSKEGSLLLIESRDSCFVMQRYKDEDGRLANKPIHSLNFQDAMNTVFKAARADLIKYVGVELTKDDTSMRYVALKCELVSLYTGTKEVIIRVGDNKYEVPEDLVHKSGKAVYVKMYNIPSEELFSVRMPGTTLEGEGDLTLPRSCFYRSDELDAL